MLKKSIAAVLFFKKLSYFCNALRQLHIYRNGKKVLVLKRKSAPKLTKEYQICELLSKS